MKRLLSNDKLRKFVRFSIFFTILLICAGNVTNSFFLKWGFRDSENRNNLISMSNGTAYKPYVYRSIVPQLVKVLVAKIDQSSKEMIFKKITRYDSLRKNYFPNISIEQWTPDVAIIYHVMYLLVYWSFFATLFVIAKLSETICEGKYFQQLSAVIIFCLIYPLTFKGGGYFYDFFEILGLFLSLLLFLKNRLLLSSFVLFLFAFCKETLFLFPAFLFFLYPEGTARLEKFKWFLPTFFACIVARYLITSGYQGNLGGDIETNWAINLKFWINPSFLFEFSNQIGKGVFTPAIENIIFLVPLVVWFYFGWQYTEKKYKIFLKASLIPTLILFFIFGFKDEVRALSLAFPSVFIILMVGFSSFRSWIEIEKV